MVDIGFLRSGRHLWEGGLGLDYDRIVPVEVVAAASDQRLVLSMAAKAFKDAPEYTEESFTGAMDLSPNEFDIPDVVNRAQLLADGIASVPGVWLFERLNKPLDSVDIIEATSVWRRDPHTKLGEVKRLILAADGTLQALVVQRGFLLHRDVILPVRYIAELMDDLIRVDISDAELDQLREYHEQP